MLKDFKDLSLSFANIHKKLKVFPFFSSFGPGQTEHNSVALWDVFLLWSAVRE